MMFAKLSNFDFQKFGKILIVYCLCIFLLSLTYTSIKSAYVVEVIGQNVDSLAKTANTGIDKNLRQLEKDLISMHGLSISLRDGIVANDSRLKDIQGKAFESMDTMASSAAKTFNNINQKTSTILDSTNTLVNSTNDLVLAAHRNLDNVSNEIVDTIQAIRGQVLVVLNNEVVGVLRASQDNLNAIGAELRKIFGDADITVQQVNQVLGNVDELAFYVAKIAKTGSETAEFYKNKLMHPSKWERAKQIINVVLYAMGSIVIPWLIVRKVEVVN